MTNTHMCRNFNKATFVKAVQSTSEDNGFEWSSEG